MEANACGESVYSDGEAKEGESHNNISTNEYLSSIPDFVGEKKNTRETTLKLPKPVCTFRLLGTTKMGIVC